ncbi:hypothetical protein [Streptomyces sp. NPDC057686]|uniref:hypothetical protein n=1 Tax=Streptomyces sp. NPDC057686 TaxID=3346212 RepID=UPI003696420E
MSGPESADHVSVQLTGCGHQDAGAVFRTLEAAFPEEGEPSRSDVQDPGSEKPMVWTMIVDSRTGRSPSTATPVSLSGPVDVGLIGAADPVRKVERELAAAFTVEGRGTVPGEHEMEARLRLT